MASRSPADVAARFASVVGRRFGSLTVTARVSGSAISTALWRCRCDCGATVERRPQNLLRGRTSSCGCQTGDKIAARHRKHGHAPRAGRSPEHSAWSDMRARCSDPESASFPCYGARGIGVCDRWQDFATFLADMGPRPSPKHSIDRINNDGNYEPGNCRWATAREQSWNRRVTRRIDCDGVSVPIAALALAAGITRNRAYALANRGSLLVSLTPDCIRVVRARFAVEIVDEVKP